MVGLLGLAAACGSEDAADEPVSPPAIEPGGQAEGAVAIDGTDISYVTVTPAGFEPGASAPVLLALPPGGQDIDLTRSVVERTYRAEAVRLGWVVVSPAAPDGTLYFDGSEALLPGLVEWIETWVEVEGGNPHVAGISNGGISSFRYAAENPDRVASIVAFPGFPRSDADRSALDELTDVPVRLYVGGDDTGWIQPAEEAVARLTELGGDAELEIFPGEGHVMASTADGTLVFEQLESFR